MFQLEMFFTVNTCQENGVEAIDLQTHRFWDCFVLLRQLFTINSSSVPLLHTLIKFWRYNKVNLATLAFGATLAQTKIDVKQVEQVYASAKFPELNRVDSCWGFPTELTPQGYPCCIVKNFWECRTHTKHWTCPHSCSFRQIFTHNQSHVCHLVPRSGSVNLNQSWKIRT